MVNALKSLWEEPAAPNPPARVWRDWVLVAAVLGLAVIEILVRPDVTWRPVAFVVCGAMGLALLWRRTHPLAVVLAVFGVVTVVDIPSAMSPGEPFGLYTMAFVLLLPYALCRWGSGRSIILGLGFILGTHILRELVRTNYRDLAFGIPILLCVAALGFALRYRESARNRQIEQVQLQEREQLARELHDTVAHHVSAIAIQAQAGRVVAATDPAAAIEALRTIEAEASRTLAEMRFMVGALRNDQAAELVPQRGITDIELLAESTGGARSVSVELSGDLDGLRPAVEATVYRLAQESVTNAVRHARNATRIDVRVTGDADAVRLSVVDDGDVSASTRSSRGYGLVGMKERATILGGTLEAGPAPDHGWAVTAVLPREGGDP